MRILASIFAFSFLTSCGSEQPTGDVTSCAGSTRIQEVSYDVNDGDLRYLGSSTAIGQYVRFRNDVLATEMMLRVWTISATSMTVNIYKNRLSDSMQEGATPIKSFTITEGLTPDENFEMWMTLPEPFQFAATTAEEVAAANFYLVTFQPNDGQIVFDIRNRGTSSLLRQGLREGNANVFSSVNTGTAVDMGFSGIANCR